MSQGFSAVRVHPDAPEITAPLRARAVTVGRDIYFQPGQYRPGTPRSDALIAHELAHTLQTRGHEHGVSARGNVVSQPGDALEKNAEALVAGRTTHALAAAPGAILRSPFDTETDVDRARREQLLQSIDNAIRKLLGLLQSGGLIKNVETPVEREGVRGVDYGTPGTENEIFSSYAERNRRIHRIIRALAAMATLYRTAPIPAEFEAPKFEQEEGDTSGSYVSRITYPPGRGYSQVIHSANTSASVDLSAAYTRYSITQGWIGGPFHFDWLYLDPRKTVVPDAAHGAPRTGRGAPSGAYVVFPDIENEPLRYRIIDGYTASPRGSDIIELWHDDFGYYYEHKGQRIYVPKPWGSSRM